MIGLWKPLRECERLPRGYGIAWIDPYAEMAWCLPVPLHLFAGVIRRWWHLMRAKVSPSVLDAAFRSGYRAGRWRNQRWAQEEAERIASNLLRIEADLRRKSLIPKDLP
jgi:hypothetical protein